jgi:hypothetical protein
MDRIHAKTNEHNFCVVNISNIINIVAIH